MVISVEAYISCKTLVEFEFLENCKRDESFEGVESIEDCYCNFTGEFTGVQITYY